MIASSDGWRRLGMLAVFLFLVVLVGIAYLGIRFLGDTPVEHKTSEAHFKYGSLGSEHEFGMPYWIWRALPEVFPDKLPGKGWQSLGFVFEKGQDLPVGMSKRRYRGFDLVWLNCAFCHTGTVRDSPESEPRVIAAMPANTFDFRRFIQFLFDASVDPRFNPYRIILEIDRMGGELDLIDRAILRLYAIRYMRERVLGLRARLEPLYRLQPELWGPGRVDTFNPLKVYFGFPLEKLPAEELVGTTDFPSIWNQGKRRGMHLHWDGNNASLEERNRSAALGSGVTPPTLDRPSMERVERWLLELTPPPYPYPIDRALAAAGAPIYVQYCADCHGADGKSFTGKWVGQVTPIEAIGTDPHRLTSYTLLVAQNQNLLYAGYDNERFRHFRKTQGYANMPLDGLWLRAPYLHNGSVPTLRDLLEPSGRRPAIFYRGHDVYDRARVGFVSTVPAEGSRTYFRFDTSQRGNSNRGHEGRRYGTELSPADKDALVEYLKTF
ncbi:MAG: cytochrome c [Candidatus Rokubacteria bacterium]|nr:cytochrome c [Candidatus Rokubacteria bacterium]